ncbi:MAG: phytanoyl-CoA dioxygenase family protein [Pseudomonadota bacterium]
MLADVRGLDAFWELGTGRRQGGMCMAERMLIDTLGLGLEQVLTYLRRENPDYPAFQAWVIETAGRPDPVTLARYHNWLDGLPPPEAVQRQLDAIDAAPPVLDADDLAHWEREGYVILRNAVTADEAAAAADLLWRTLGASPGDPETWYAELPGGIMVQHFQGEAMEAPRRSGRVHKAFAQLWGTADLWHLVDRLSFNPPVRPDYRFRATGIHWDVSIAPPIPFSTQGILYLTDTAADQGALQLVPGFHHRLAGGWLDGLGDANPREVDFSTEAVTVGAGAGDLVIWRSELPHGASPNRARRPRLAQYVTMYATDLVANPVWI